MIFYLLDFIMVLKGVSKSPAEGARLASCCGEKKNNDKTKLKNPMRSNAERSWRCRGETPQSSLCHDFLMHKGAGVWKHRVRETRIPTLQRHGQKKNFVILLWGLVFPESHSLSGPFVVALIVKCFSESTKRVNIASYVSKYAVVLGIINWLDYSRRVQS